MTRRRKIGDVYAIPLPDGTFAFGRMIEKPSVAFYKHRGQNINDLPASEEYEFTVCCYNDCFKEWIFVENRPFSDENEAKSPPYQLKDVFTGEYRISQSGNIRPASKEECEGLEVCAVWAHSHLVKRLTGDMSWEKYFPGFYEE